MFTPYPYFPHAPMYPMPIFTHKPILTRMPTITPIPLFTPPMPLCTPCPYLPFPPLREAVSSAFTLFTCRNSILNFPPFYSDEKLQSRYNLPTVQEVSHCTRGVPLYKRCPTVPKMSHCTKSVPLYQRCPTLQEVSHSTKGVPQYQRSSHNHVTSRGRYSVDILKYLEQISTKYLLQKFSFYQKKCDHRGNRAVVTFSSQKYKS